MSTATDYVGPATPLTCSDGEGERVEAAVFAGMSGDELLSELEQIERERAALVARSVVLMEVMARGRRREALAALAPDVPAGRRTLEVAEADACVVDEVALATGLRVHECRARLDLACGDASRTGPIRAALGRGELSWERARRVMDSVSTTGEN